jgi:hypothetical protein
MATYDPVQPMWKRVLAGILDFLLAFVVFGLVLGKIFPPESHAVPSFPGMTTTELFGLSGWPAFLLLALIIAYFVGLGRTGGTVFQRLFGMKRVRSRI